MSTSTQLISVAVRNVLIATGLALSCCMPANAAPAQDGFVPDLRDIAGLPVYSTNTVAVAKSLQQTQTSKSAPLQYGVVAALPLQLSDGVWSSADASTDVWRLRITSSGAHSLSAQFSQYQMPEGGALYIYDHDGKLVQGPYTAANNTAAGQLWTAMVKSDEAIVEVRVPSAKRDQLKLSISGVMHGFIDPFSVTSGGTSKSLSGTAAGSCEVNVAAPPGNNWGSEIRSVGAYTVQAGKSGIVCTGQLINDIPQDGKPYFLTAYHCAVSNAAAAASVVVYWNYQASSACGTDTGNLMNQNQTGSTLVAGDVNADFTLLLLAQTPNSAYNVYSAGFDASGTGANNGAGIHHPDGDIKKISNFNSAVTQQTVQFAADTDTSIPARTVKAWQVNWFSGVTEEGSSGSGLWNQNRQIIGVLSGGGSDCSTPTGSDYYARLDIAWTANTASSGQLKASLDPNNTGARTVGGRNANGTAGPTGTVPPLDATYSCSSSTTGSTTGGVVSAPVASSFGSGGGGAFSPLLLMLLAPLARRRRRN